MRKRNDRSRRRLFLLSGLLLVCGMLLLPLFAYLQPHGGEGLAEAAPPPGEEVNPRAEYWREVRQGDAGYT